MSFSENLQFLRARAGMTQEQLAEQLEVSRQSVSKWESGASFPEMDTILRICDMYQCDLDTLLRGSVEQSLVTDTARYDEAMNRFSLQISCSVGAIVAAVGLMMPLMAFGVSEVLTAAFLLLVITISTVVMVAGGIQQEHFRKKHPYIDDFYTEEEKETFHKKFVWLIAGGVGAILFGVIFMLLFNHLLPETEAEKEFYGMLSGGIFLLIVAGAVTAFTYAGLQEEKYKIWQYNRENDPTPEAKKRNQLIGTCCAVIMLLATAIYVGLGLTRNLWGTAWWVFPVGGILCGVASVILDPYKDDD